MLRLIPYCLLLLLCASLQAEISIKIGNPKNIHFVDETINLNIDSDRSGFINLRLIDGRQEHVLTRAVPNTNSYSFKLPYIQNKKVSIAAELEIPQVSSPIWIEKSAHSTEARSAVFSSDSRTLISASESEVKFWDISSRSLIRRIDLSRFSRVRHVTYLNQDTIFISTAESLIMYDIGNNAYFNITEGVSSGNVRMAKFRANRSQIVFGSDKGFVGIYDYSTMNYVKKFKVSDDDTKNEIYSIACSSTGDSLLCGTYNGYVYLIDINSDEIKEFGKHGEGNQSTVVFDVSFSADGKSIISTGGDRTIRIWNINNSTERTLSDKHSLTIRSCDVSSDGKTLISASLDSVIKFTDFETGYSYYSYSYSSQFLYSEISPNGKLLAATARDGSLLVWDLQKAEIQNDVVNINCGYKFKLKFDDISGMYGEQKSAGIKVKHNYLAYKMPYPRYEIDVYAKYPSKNLFYRDEVTAGDIRYRAEGSTNSGIADKLYFTVLAGFENNSKIQIDSIICVSPDLYYFEGEESYISTFSNCIANPKQIIVDNAPQMNIAYENKALSIDIYSIENGEATLLIYDLNGRLVYSEKNVNLQIGWNKLLRNTYFSQGMYAVNIIFASGYMISGTSLF